MLLYNAAFMIFCGAYFAGVSAELGNVFLDPF